MRSPQLAARVRQSVKRSGLSQAEVARATGVAPATVSNWMSHGHGLTLQNLTKLAAVLDVCPIWLAFGAIYSDRLLHSEDEIAIIRRFRQMEPKVQRAILRLSVQLRTHLPATTAMLTEWDGRVSHSRNDP